MVDQIAVGPWAQEHPQIDHLQLNPPSSMVDQIAVGPWALGHPQIAHQKSNRHSEDLVDYLVMVGMSARCCSSRHTEEKNKKVSKESCLVWSGLVWTEQRTFLVLTRTSPIWKVGKTKTWSGLV